MTSPTSQVVNDIANESNQELLKIIPTHWIIDDTEVVKNPPQWLPAKKVDIVADTFYVPKGFYDQLVEIIQSLDIYVADIIPNILATAESTIDYEAGDLWCVTIDIGKEQTSFVIYEDGYPTRYETIPVWWDFVTKDISIGMQTDIREAEMIKIQHGAVGEVEESKKQDTSLDQHFLNEIVTARYEQILTIINERLIELGKDGRLAGWAILSWGWSKIPNLTELGKDIFQLATFSGDDVHLTSKEVQWDTQFINTLGTYNRSEKHSHNSSWLGMNMQLGIDTLGKIKSFFQKLF